MKRIACQYAILRFMPYVETSEFANVGIVLAAGNTGYFGFQLQEKRYKRLTDFFKDLDSRTYKTAIQAMKNELTRIQQLASSQTALTAGLFQELTRPREALFRFSEPGVVLTDDLTKTLAELYEHYVEHSFVTPQYRETVLEKRIRTLLKQYDLANQYKATKLGDNEYQVALPFVARLGRQVCKAIKPLDLRQPETIKMVEKAGQWQFRMKELARRGKQPRQMLFAVDGPVDQGTPHTQAYERAIDLLAETGAEVIAMAETERLAEFVVG
ncbi:DUF3037 domain-containing protein [Halomonas hibernica]|uniref:DUF3037 domain-containing protein n=1 Tax=Halomonas hibernica TaxID=2591147 RepID=UPI001553BA08|nr:DUF3037 domain-containing protein [Halomonas hibernica]